jgi:type III restriction enzyme
LTELDNFSASSGINVMIINIQAFNTSLKEDARSKEARRIYEKLDEFGSRRPIDVIKANRPILILDEPQKMGGDKTQKALANFNPLFCLNYSATHVQHHNLVYVLDAVDAYNKRLVKKIEVKGFEVKNFRGTDRYLFLENIIISPKKPPMAKIELEIKYQKSVNQPRRRASSEVGDDLYVVSNEMEQYKGYHISDIDPIRGTVTFTNGVVLSRGEVIGDVSEKDLRRIQIRETIISHFEKEKHLFELGIKTLSLFFIDEVAKYRKYNEAGEEVNSEYGEMFEQEYINVLNDYITLEDTPYIRYLKSIDPAKTHAGYFSIDKHGRKVDSPTKRGSDESDDISAYDLILKDKERLLSFEEPVRFIFSHSALREGWDNPNVFQICTLKHGGASPTQKRQEVGRGLRLCVNQRGERMDVEKCADSVHSINVLTVIASEGYKNFVADLQTGIKEALYERPTKATVEYFTGKTVMVGEKTHVLNMQEARDIYRYLIKNDYIDNNDGITEATGQTWKTTVWLRCLNPSRPLARVCMR